jgi:hypothetical protein
MPATKANVVVSTAQSILSGASVQTAWVPILDDYEAHWHIKINNHATLFLGKPVVIQVEISPDQVAGSQIPLDCRLVGKQPAAEVSRFEVRVPLGVRNTRLNITGGDQNCTIDAVLTVVEGV